MKSLTALGASALGTTVTKLGTLVANTGADLVKEPLVLAGRLEGFLSKGWSGSIALVGSFATIDVFRFFSIPLPSTFTLSGTVSGSGVLIKDGDGALILTGNNTYAGVTFVKAGVLSVRNTSALGRGPSGTQVNIGATLDVQGGLTISERLAMGGNLHSLAGNNTWTGAIELFANSSMTVDENQLAIDSVISSKPFGNSVLVTHITKLGEGKLIFLKANTYAGFTDVSEGVLNIQNKSALGMSGSGINATEVRTRALELQAAFRSFAGMTINESLTLAGAGIENQGALRNIFGTNAWTGPVTLKNGAFIGVEPNSDRL